jgi:hypothetical protein
VSYFMSYFVSYLCHIFLSGLIWAARGLYGPQGPYTSLEGPYKVSKELLRQRPYKILKGLIRSIRALESPQKSYRLLRPQRALKGLITLLRAVNS